MVKKIRKKSKKRRLKEIVKKENLDVTQEPSTFEGIKEEFKEIFVVKKKIKKKKENKYISKKKHSGYNINQKYQGKKYKIEEQKETPTEVEEDYKPKEKIENSYEKSILYHLENIGAITKEPYKKCSYYAKKIRNLLMKKHK